MFEMCCVSLWCYPAIPNDSIGQIKQFHFTVYLEFQPNGFCAPTPALFPRLLLIRIISASNSNEMCDIWRHVSHFILNRIHAETFYWKFENYTHTRNKHTNLCVKSVFFVKFKEAINGINSDFMKMIPKILNFISPQNFMKWNNNINAMTVLNYTLMHKINGYGLAMVV